jgi:hypothetical protein
VVEKWVDAAASGNADIVGAMFERHAVGVRNPPLEVERIASGDDVVERSVRPSKVMGSLPSLSRLRRSSPLARGSGRFYMSERRSCGVWQEKTSPGPYRS